MNILFTSIIDLHKSQHNRPHQFLKHLSQRHDITVISINDWWKGQQADLTAYAAEFHEVFDRIQYHYVTERRISPSVQELLGHRVLTRLDLAGFDVHLNYNTLVLGHTASRHVPTVYDLADDLVAMIRASPHIPGPLRHIGSILGSHMLHRNIQRSDTVTVTTHALQSKFQIPVQKIAIIPNGVNTTQFSSARSAKRDVGVSGFVLGYVGVLREWVDLEPVFQALHALPREIQLLIVGQEGRFRENQALARHYHLEDRVHFSGMVPYSQIPTYIAAMDVGLIPFKEGSIAASALPLKLFEYMACEKPTISTPIPGVKQVAADAVCYASQPTDYCEHILQLYSDTQLRRRLGQRGRQIVEQGYSWSAIGEQLEQILHTASNNVERCP
jgi:glycosyltransferase involved in cell wall biosynthesis